MKKKELSLIFILFVLITFAFFYKTFTKGLVPIPADLLIGVYNPWKTFSYFGYIPGSFPNKAQYPDVIRQMYPWKTLVISLFKSGQIPLWNPYNFSGAPLLANFQSSAFYLLNVFYFLIPFIWAWTTLIMLQTILSSFFTYLFTRKIGLRIMPALFASLTFAFSVYQTVWLEYNTVLQVILWLPFILFAIEKTLEKKNFIWPAFLILGVALAIFAGHPQIAAYVIIFSYIYGIYRILTRVEIKNKKVPAIFISLFFLLGIGVSGIQLIPGLELIKFGARSSHNFNFYISKLLIQPWQWVMFFVPDFFGNPATANYWITDTYVSKVTGIGIVAVPFIFISFKKFANPVIRFFLITGILLIFISTANPITNLLYRYPMSFLLAGSPALFLFLFCFSVSILSGFGLQTFLDKKATIKLTLFPLTIIFIMLWVVVFVWKFSFPINLRVFSVVALKALLLQSVIFAFFGALVLFLNKWQRIFISLLIIIQAAGLFYAFQKFNPFVSTRTIFPSNPITSYLQKNAGINRYWGFGESGVEANFATQYQIFSPDGYDPLYPSWYGGFIQASANGQIATSFTDQTRSDAKIALSGSLDFSQNQNRLKILNLLGVKYILDRIENGSTEKTFPPIQYSQVYKNNGWFIYNNANALPRAFLVGAYTIYNSPSDFQKKFFDKQFNPAKTLLLTKSIPQKIARDPQSNVLIKSYSPNRILIASKSNTTQLLFLSDTYFPGWKVFVDGKEEEIYRADYAFRAAVVPGGNHTVLFSYAPMSFYLGINVTIISLLAGFGLVVVFKRFSYEK